MSNYVFNKVVCKKEFFEKYLLDYGVSDKGEQYTFLSFAKLFADKKTDENTKYFCEGEYWGTQYVFINISEELCELRFSNRWVYHIEAIIKAIEISHDIIWYASEENHIYVSKFYWNNEVKEDVLYTETEYYNWLEQNMTFGDDLNIEDDDIWYFLPLSTEKWKNWESKDNFKRYLNTAVIEIEKPFK